MMSIELKLALMWIALMLVYLLGDVLRIFSGDLTPGEIMGEKTTQGMWLGIAVLMVIPIVMIVLTIILPQEVLRPATIIVFGFFFVFNLFGLPTYPSAYDRFLLIVSMVFNIIIIAFAWQWV